MTEINQNHSFHTVLKRAGQHARSLRWDATNNRLWWTDPTKEAVASWEPETNSRDRIPLQDAVYTVCPTQGGRLLLGLSKRLCLIELQQRKGRRPDRVRWLAVVDALDPRTVISGGRADRAGNFVFSTRNIAPDGRAIGSFYQYSQQFGLRRLALPTVVAANSICFSLDGSRMYFADESTAVMYQCRYTPASASISDLQPFAHVRDGATPIDALVDSDDCVWSVQQRPDAGSAVVCYQPDGKQARMIDIPQSRITGLAAYGTDLQQLIVMDHTGTLSMAAHFTLRGYAEARFDDSQLSHGWVER
ncbi:SMP-30/gluconolactonase/LRE family protein [Duganella sp. PWIR1]